MRLPLTSVATANHVRKVGESLIAVVALAAAEEHLRVFVHGNTLLPKTADDTHTHIINRLNKMSKQDTRLAVLIIYSRLKIHITNQYYVSRSRHCFCDLMANKCLSRLLNLWHFHSIILLPGDKDHFAEVLISSFLMRIYDLTPPNSANAPYWEESQDL